MTEQTTTSTPRPRIVSITVQPVVLMDDGVTLTPLPVAPVEVPAHVWDTFASGGLAAIQAQVEELAAQAQAGDQ